MPLGTQGTLSTRRSSELHGAEPKRVTFRRKATVGACEGPASLRVVSASKGGRRPVRCQTADQSERGIVPARFPTASTPLGSAAGRGTSPTMGNAPPCPPHDEAGRHGPNRKRPTTSLLDESGNLVATVAVVIIILSLGVNVQFHRPTSAANGGDPSTER
ncbi:hypothetical protein PG993_000220 [Apiospora rasikravindrae]|uniref:Uncharacterized protein n=1 Tax=Apiospora rasikravindrae TaxID=990691 RepID=A0ABR1UAN0_9PEZI